MKFQKLTIVLFVSLFLNNLLIAEVPHFLDFKHILNSSDAGKEAQDYLKNKLETGLKNISTKEKKILDEEKQIINQKKLITPEEYKKKVSDLRKKVLSIQNERKSLLDSVGEKRLKARTTLLKNLNPIIKEYMNENKIRMVVDKKSLLLADEKLDITKDIMNLLNKKLKSINLN